jgi:hypothetical protein
MSEKTELARRLIDAFTALDLAEAQRIRASRRAPGDASTPRELSRFAGMTGCTSGLTASNAVVTAGVYGGRDDALTEIESAAAG